MAKKSTIASKFGSSFNISPEEMMKVGKSIESQVKKESSENQDGAKGGEPKVEPNDNLSGPPQVIKGDESSVKTNAKETNGSSPAVKTDGSNLLKPSNDETIEGHQEPETIISSETEDNRGDERITGKGKRTGKDLDDEDVSFEDFLEKFHLGKEDKYTNFTISDAINKEFKIIAAYLPGVAVRDLGCNILANWLVKYRKEIEKVKKGKK